MKTYLIASIGSLFLAAGFPYAGAVELKAPAPVVNMLNEPDCPAGFVKTNASGDPKGNHSYVCTTREIHCPRPPSTAYSGGMSQQQARSMGIGPQQGVQFSYTCSYVHTPN